MQVLPKYQRVTFVPIHACLTHLVCAGWVSKRVECCRECCLLWLFTELVDSLFVWMDGHDTPIYIRLGAVKCITNYTGNTEINTPGTIIMQVLPKYQRVGRLSM